MPLRLPVFVGQAFDRWGKREAVQFAAAGFAFRLLEALGRVVYCC